jgi:hypothetical protein
VPGISEKPVSPDTLLSIKKCARIALKVLGMEPRQSTPSAIVAGLDEFVVQWQKGIRPDQSLLSSDDAPLIMGSLWGEAVISRFGWQWAMVTFHDHDNAIAPAVVSPDRAVAIYPLHHLTGCFVDSAEGSIVAAYNILKAGIDDAVPRSYSDLMESMRRVVPRV